MRRVHRTLLLILVIALLAELAFPIQLTKQTMQLKTGKMLGSVGLSMAQWDLEFDEDLYYFEAPPCAPGLTRQNLTAAAVAADPCWAGCDFTSSDADQCGQPFNTTDPRCQAICDAHPKKATLCDFTNRPWTVIEPDVESPLYTIKVNELLHIRFNWLQVERGFRYEGMPTQGPISTAGVALMDYAAELDGGTFCLGKTSASSFTNVCPSCQCFYYGTWELSVGIIIESIISDYVGTSSHILRTFPQVEGNKRRTVPRADAPVTYPEQYSALHTPLQFGVTLDVQFVNKSSAHFYQLTTPYCGFINIQHEKAEWNRPIARVAACVSTDGTPYPISARTDLIFLNHGIKPVWICPKPPETNVTVFIAITRYVGTGEPALTKNELHYVTVDYYRPEDQWKKYRLGSTAAESGFSNFTNFPPLVSWNNGLGANTFRLSCPNPANLSTTKFFDCRSGSSNLGTCLEFLLGLPVEPWTVSLLPVPTVVSNINPESFNNVEYSSFQNTARKKLSAFLILELSSDGSIVSQTLGADWKNLWTQCVLHIGTDTSVASIDGEWFFADLALSETVPECVYSEFAELSELITTGIASMAEDPLSAYSERVLIDELTFHDPWQACNTFIASDLSTASTAKVQVFGTTACLNSSDAEDPCCNTDVAWTQCCASRDVTAVVETLALDSEATNATCHHATCVEPLLEEYYRAHLSDSVGGCSGPDLNSKLRAPLRVYRDCREAAFGDDFEVPKCVVDSDCTSLVSNTSTYCNQVTKQCAFNFTDSMAYFFECLADNLPIEARIKLIALNSYTVSESEPLAILLHNTYGKTTECVDHALGSPWTFFNDYLQAGSNFGGCATCNQSATDLTSQLPPWCEFRAGSACTYEWTVHPKTAGCTTQVCNWDQSDDCNATLLGTFFCGVCESDALCTQISDESAGSRCEEIPSVCFLANGTVRTDLTEAECSQTYSCTLECIDGECGNRVECEGMGYCEPDDEIYEAMAASDWNTVVSPTGFCATPMNPFNTPDCSVDHDIALPTSYGCVQFGDCVGQVAALICTPNYYTEELCATLPDAVWWPRYNKTSCLSASGCSEQLVGVESLSSLGSRLRSPKDEEQCSMCDGEIETLSSWVSGRWLPGTARTPQWIERTLVTRYTMSESVDFNTLYDDIYSSSRAAVAFQLQNNIQCSYQTINKLISQVTCACTTNLSREECFPGSLIEEVGQGEACPLTSNTIVAPPAILGYDMNDVSSELQNQCVEFDIDRISSRFFYGETPPPISTGFVPKFTIRGWNAVVNEQGATVGQVIGDGIQIQFTQNGKYLTSLKVCLLISSSISLSDNGVFTEYGLGYWTGSTNPATVVPITNLNNVSVDNGYVCGVVQLAQTGEDVSFVPIYYRSDWQEQPSARFSSGQKALLYIVATLYALLCFAILVQLIRLVFVVSAWDFNMTTNYMWVLLFFMTIIRAVYIYLVAADVLGQQNTHLLVDFWMMDLPTLLYLICDAVIASSFLFLLLASRNPRFQRRQHYRIALVGLICFIMAIFVAILLAFNFAVVRTQGSNGPALCSTYTDNSSEATAIRIVYESLLFTIALLIALVGGAVAAKLWWNLRDKTDASSLLALGMMLSFGILSDSLAYLIYYIVNNPTPYFAIVLIFTEILPITFLVARVSTRQIKNKQLQGKFDRGTSGRGHSYSSTSPSTHEKTTSFT